MRVCMDGYDVASEPARAIGQASQANAWPHSEASYATIKIYYSLCD